MVPLMIASEVMAATETPATDVADWVGVAVDVVVASTSTLLPGALKFEAVM